MVRVGTSVWAKSQNQCRRRLQRRHLLQRRRRFTSAATASTTAWRSTVHRRGRRHTTGSTETSIAVTTSTTAETSLELNLSNSTVASNTRPAGRRGQDSHNGAASSSSEGIAATAAWDEEANPSTDNTETNTRPAGRRRRAGNDDAASPENLEATTSWNVTATARGELTAATRAMLRKGKFIRYHMFNCWRRRLTPKQAHDEINLIANNIVCQKTVSRWYARFDGMTSDNVCFRDLPRSGRPQLKLDKERLRRIVLVTGRTASRQLGRDFGASHTTISRVLRKLKFTYRVPQTQPYQLREEQMKKRAAMCAELIHTWNNFPAMHDLVTCDETMIHMCSCQSKKKQWCMPLCCLTKAELKSIRAERRELEARGPPPGTQTCYMLVIFWNREGVVHYELLQPREKMTAERYQVILRTVAEKLGLGRHKKVFLLQDNAPAHRAESTLNLADTLGFRMLKHPPYSPDAAPSDYYLFRVMKPAVDEQAFLTRGMIETAIQTYIAGKSAEFWAKGIDSLPDRWRTITDAEGDFPNFDDNEHLMPPAVTTSA